MKKIILILSLLSFPVAAISQSQNMGYGHFDFKQDGPCLTEEERIQIQYQVQRNVEKLKREGRLSAKPSLKINLDWPLQTVSPSTGYGYHGISNFVDQNAQYPGKLLDYNCGTRTYDLSSGYNHQGTDYFLWPFTWNMMDAGLIEIIAAEAGTIVFKSDGNYDRNCNATAAASWNAVYVQHTDGSIAWYGHMRNGSVTNKSVGETVSKGEYLGLVGSSGRSSSPHLHFELHDAANDLIDPYQGNCNSLNSETWWKSQRHYYDSAINKVMTHSAAPEFTSCPEPAIINEQNVFNPGDIIYFAAYYRDQLSSHTSTYKILKPDGAVFKTWTHNSNSSHYSASYWYWWFVFPSTVVTGTWTFEVEYLGNNYVHHFEISSVGTGIETNLFAEGFSLQQNYPNPFNPETFIKYELPHPTFITLKVYNLHGQEIKTLIEGEQSAGVKTMRWLGRNNSGQVVPSNIYIYRLEAGGMVLRKKMLLIR